MDDLWILAVVEYMAGVLEAVVSKEQQVAVLCVSRFVGQAGRGLRPLGRMSTG